MKITILYGTETGNAEMLAEDIQTELKKDHEVNCLNLCDMEPSDFDVGSFYIMICSTYGEGELPASAQPFAEAMDGQAPDLTNIYFAIFGMGDSEYNETFNHGSKRLANMMISHGAVQLGERVAHDASGDELVEDLAMPWAEAVTALAEEKMCEKV